MWLPAGTSLDKSTEFAYGQDPDIDSKLASTYPIPGEPSTDVMKKQGEIAPPEREQGVETNTPGSPATNIRDDSGSSVPGGSSKDPLDSIPPLSPTVHKRSPPAPSTRKMGPTSPTTPATAASTGHAATPGSHAEPGTKPKMVDEESADSYGDTPAGFSEDYEDTSRIGEGLSSVDLAPTPELSEQQGKDREIEEFEARVEAQEQEQKAREREQASEEGPFNDPVFGTSPAPADEISEMDAGVEKQLMGGGVKHSPTPDAEKAMEMNELEAEREEEAEIAEERAYEEAEEAGVDMPADSG